MKNKVLYLLVFILISNISCAPNLGDSPPKGERVPSPVSQEISVSERITIALDNGIEVEIPEEGVYVDDTLRLEIVEENIPRNDDNSIAIPGTVYQVELENAEFFRKPALITIPYDPNLLPEGRTEGEVFALFWHEDEWHRLYGEVDETNNTISVYTLHNGLWSWGASLIDNIKKEASFWISGLVKSPENVEEARKLVEMRKEQWYESWDMLLADVDHVDELQDPLKLVVDASIHSGAHVIAAHLPFAKASAILALKGASPVAVALVAKGGVIIGTVSAVAGTYYLLEYGESWRDLLYSQRREQIAYARLKEAECILKSFKNPEALSTSPECAKYLDNYYEMLDEEQLENPLFNPELSGIPEEDEQATSIPKIVPDFFAEYKSIECFSKDMDWVDNVGWAYTGEERDCLPDSFRIELISLDDSGSFVMSKTGEYGFEFEGNLDENNSFIISQPGQEIPPLFESDHSYTTCYPSIPAGESNIEINGSDYRTYVYESICITTVSRKSHCGTEDEGITTDYYDKSSGLLLYSTYESTITGSTGCSLDNPDIIGTIDWRFTYILDNTNQPIGK